MHGPESVSWPVIGDVAAFVGGIRALLIQAAHPEVVAGVSEHSRYRADPLGRLSRTSAYVTAVTFGAMPEVDAAIAKVDRRHLPVSGNSERKIPYSADDPALAAWVHNALTDSFLRAYLEFGTRPLTPDEADRFVAEQGRVGALMRAEPLPATASSLSGWLENHPDLGSTRGMREAIGFLRTPPLSSPVRFGYRRLFRAAAATLPERLQVILGLPVRTPDRRDRAAVRALRWALGASPSWHLALTRVGAPIPEGIFRHDPGSSTDRGGCVSGS